VFSGGGRADQVVALEDEAEILAPQLRQRIAIERADIAPDEVIGTVGWAVETAENIHQRRLARARSADDCAEFAFPDIQVDAVQHLNGQIAVAIGLGYAGKCDQRLPQLATGGALCSVDGAHRGPPPMPRAPGAPPVCSALRSRWPALACAPGAPAGSLRPITIWSPSLRPESTCTWMRLLIPVWIVRSSISPVALTTLATASPPLRRCCAVTPAHTWGWAAAVPLASRLPGRSCLL